jgi:hypothetical protein
MAKLLHAILQHYNELKPREPIQSRVVFGYLPEATALGQTVLSNIGHAWVEAGRKGASPRRLDPTPVQPDPASAKRAWGDIVLYVNPTGKTPEISEESQEQAIARWWEEAREKSQASLDRVNARIQEMDSIDTGINSSYSYLLKMSFFFMMIVIVILDY